MIGRKLAEKKNPNKKQKKKEKVCPLRA